MFRFVKWFVIGFFACVFANPNARAAVNFQPVSQDELKLTSEPLAPGAPAIILFRQVDRDDNIHTPHVDNYFRIKILTEEGRKHADVEIPFFKESEDIVNIKARTIRPDGSIADFGGKIFEKYLVKGKFEGREVKYLAKTFTLADVQVGSILEYYYTVDYHEYQLFNSYWTLSDELFTKKAQFSLKPFDDNYYGQYSLRWSWNTLPSGAAAPKEGPDRRIRMEATNIPAFQTEDYMPPEDELKSRVDFIYEEGVGERDQANYWKHIGKQRNGQLESFVGKRKAMEEAVGTIVSAGDPPEVKLRKIYDRVQHMRNTTYEVQKTEQEQKRAKEKDNANVEEVWKRGYGDGVQLTWLFLGLARAAGFEASGCWVSNRRHHFFTPITMQGSKLDANVVQVNLNGTVKYFDPGGAFTPFGLVDWSETKVAGLRLDKDGGSWIQTTLPDASESRIERAGTFKLTETGDLEGKLTVTYIGLEAMLPRVEERHADEVERKKFLEEAVASQIQAASEVELTNKPDWASSETPLVAEYTLKIPGWASNAGRRAVVPAAIFTAAEKGMFEHANRVQPIYFEYPHQKIDDITIELPAGWKIDSLPAAKSVDAKAAIYKLSVEKNAEALKLSRKLTIDIVLLDPKFYAPLRNFFQVVRSGDAEQIVLQPGELHAQN